MRRSFFTRPSRSILALSLVLATALAAASPARAGLRGPRTLHARPAVHANAHLRAQLGSEALRVFRDTNSSRGRFNIGQLQLNRTMSDVARRHSLAMARAGSLYHTSDVDSYLHGVSWRIWGENVGYTSGDVDGLQNAFMNSTEHRDNILNPRFRHVAVGAVRVEGVLWVTVFFYG